MVFFSIEKGKVNEDDEINEKVKSVSRTGKDRCLPRRRFTWLNNYTAIMQGSRVKASGVLSSELQLPVYAEPQYERSNNSNSCFLMNFRALFFCKCMQSARLEDSTVHLTYVICPEFGTRLTDCRIEIDGMVSKDVPWFKCRVSPLAERHTGPRNSNTDCL